MFKVFVMILSLFLFHLQGQNYTLKESLQKAEVGDYIVYDTARFYTMLYVKSFKNDLVTLEEVSVAVDCINSMKTGSQPFDFVSWLKKGAYNASSWITYTFDLDKGKILHTFSCTKKTNQSPNTLLATLLNLSCTKAPSRKMTKKGALWNPPLPFNGSLLKKDTEEWKALWPNDGSLLAGSHLTLFTAEPPLLSLPYWIELQKDQRRVLLRAFASGNLASQNHK